MPWGSLAGFGGVFPQHLAADAVAALAMTKGLKGPRKIIVILEGESLVNDVTSFISFRFAVAAVPLVVILPNDHRLAALKSISPRDLVGETFVSVSDTAPVLRVVIDNYLKRSGVNITPAHEVDHLAIAMSLIASTRGVALLPVYAENFLASSLTSRPLKGDTPSVDLVLGYKKSNKSPILKLLLSRLDELVARVSKREKV